MHKGFEPLIAEHPIYKPAIRIRIGDTDLSIGGHKPWYSPGCRGFIWDVLAMQTVEDLEKSFTVLASSFDYSTFLNDLAGFTGLPKLRVIPVKDFFFIPVRRKWMENLFLMSLILRRLQVHTNDVGLILFCQSSGIKAYETISDANSKHSLTVSKEIDWLRFFEHWKVIFPETSFKETKTLYHHNNGFGELFRNYHTPNVNQEYIERVWKCLNL